MAITLIQAVRLSVGDTDPALPLLVDDVYQYYLDRNYNSVNKTSIDAARAILMYMAQRSEDTSVDLFSTKSSKAVTAYIQALQLFLKDPSLNPVYQNVQAYASGISVSDMQANNSNSDNVASRSPFLGCTTDDSYFGVPQGGLYVSG